MSEPRLIDRKELARLIGIVTPRMVRDNERAWGIAQFKVVVSRNLVAYERSKALATLRSRRLL